jgi:hypothetical protein
VTASDWFKVRRALAIRFAVPINRAGDTAELHAWYDQVLFSDTSPMASQEMSKPDR